MEYDYLFKILLLGDSGVGKSCIILRYTDNQFNNNLMNSIGVDFKLKHIELDEKKIKLQIWDTAGQERFRTITTSYYRGAQAIVIVYDVTDRESFDHVKNWMVDIDRFAKENVLRVLIGNKSDIENKRVITTDEGRDLGKAYNIIFMETSAKANNNIEGLFNSIVRVFLEKNGVTNNMNFKEISNIKLNHDDKHTVKKDGSGCC